MKKTTLFDIPIWTNKIDNFYSVRKQLEDEFNKFPDTKNEINQSEYQKFYTNRQKDRPGLTQKFTNIISKEVQNLVSDINKNSDIKIKDLTVKDVWSVTYQTGDYQSIHNHGSTGLSGLLFLDSPIDGPNLTIVQPYNNWITDTTRSLSAKFEEGAIVVFPSFLLHSSDPNRSHRQKRVISWDMEIVL